MEELVEISKELKAFYSFPNEVDTAQLSTASKRIVYEMESHLVKGHRAIFPALVSGAIRWYGIAPNNVEARKLGEEVDGWLGTPISYRITNFEKCGIDYDVIDQRAVELTNGGRTYRIDISNEWKKIARQNVETLLHLWAMAPRSNQESYRSLGQILGEFFASLANSDRKRSEEILDELKGKALVTATNLRFLKIALLHKFQDFESMLNDPGLRDISNLRMPNAVTELIADAINEVFICHHKDFENIDLAELAAQIDSQAAFVVDGSSKTTSINIARCLLLREVYFNESNDIELIDRFSPFLDDPLVSVICSDLKKRKFNSEQSTSLDSIYEHEQFEPDNIPEIIEWLMFDIRTALEDGSVETISAAREKYSVASIAVKQLVAKFRPYKQLVTELENFTLETQVPSNWIEWLERSPNTLSDQLFNWSRGWKRDKKSIELLNRKWASELINAVADVQKSKSVIDGLSVFVEWLTRDGLPPSCSRICADTVYVLLTSDSSRTYRDLSLKLIDELLTVGCTETMYAELITSVSDAFRKIGPREVSWVIRIMETFYISSTPSTEKRQTLANEVVELSKKWRDRITSVDLITLNLLFTEFLEGHLPIRLNEDIGLRTLKAKPVKSVLIYSLLESAGKAAANWIENQFVGTKVRTSSQHVNSDSLSSMAKSSDVVIVQTSHAKHAATSAIDEAVKNKDRLVKVDGRGTSSIIRAFLNWIYSM